MKKISYSLKKHFGIDTFVKDGIVVIRKHLSGADLENMVKQYDAVTEWKPMNASHAQSLQNATALKHYVKDKTFDKMIFDTVSAAFNIYNLFYPHARLSISSDQRYRLNKYTPGRGYYDHVDCHNQNAEYRSRLISTVLQINEDYEGGVLEFPNQNLKIELKAGDIIFFPGIYTHPHSVTPVKSGTRKNIVTWLT